MKYGSSSLALLAIVAAVGATACTTEVIKRPAPVDATASDTAPTDDAPEDPSARPRPVPVDPPDDATPPTCEEQLSSAELRSPVPERRRAPMRACTDAEIAGVSNPNTDFSTGCLDCLMRDPSDPSSQYTGCLVARGEPAACAEVEGKTLLCVVDACASCDPGSADARACLAAAETGQCKPLRDLSRCSAKIADNIQFCSDWSMYGFMCGGKGVVGTCSPLEQQGTDVMPAVGATIPTLGGGSIAQGTYVLVKMEGFGSAVALLPQGAQRATLAVTGNKIDQVAVNAAGKVSSNSGTYVTSGASLTLTNTCPSSQVAPYRFEATATSLVLAFGFGPGAEGDGIVMTYTKK